MTVKLEVDPGPARLHYRHLYPLLSMLLPMPVRVTFSHHLVGHVESDPSSQCELGTAEIRARGWVWRNRVFRVRCV